MASHPLAPYALSAGALFLVLFHVRKFCWKILYKRAHELNFGTAHHLHRSWNHVPAHHFTWYSSLLAPHALPAYLKEIARSTTRGGIRYLAMKPWLELLGNRMADQLRNPQSDHNARYQTFLSIAVDIGFLGGMAVDMPVLSWRQEGFLTEKSLVEPIDFHPKPSDETDGVDLVDGLLLYSSVSNTIKQVPAVQEGHKTVSEAVADGAVDVGVSATGFYTRMILVSVEVSAEIAFGVGLGTKSILHQIINFAHKSNLRALYKKNTEALQALGSEVHRPEHIQLIRFLINEELLRIQQAVAVVEKEVSVQKMSPLYWICPSKKHTISAVTLDNGRRIEHFIRGDNFTMNSHVSKIQQPERKDELLGILVMRNRVFRERIFGDDPTLLGPLETARRNVVIEKKRLRQRYGI